MPITVAAADGDETVEASDVWNIMTGTANGGCDNWRTVIDRWHDESGELVDNAASYLATYETDYRVRAAVQSFFGLKPQKAGIGESVRAANTKMFDKLKENFLDMSRFFNGEIASTKYPGLFCDTTWMQPVASTDTARDEEGTEIYVNDVPQTIGKLYAKRLGNSKVPFWSDFLKAYEFGLATDGPAFCANHKDTKGATSSLTGSSGVQKVAVSLCPLAFAGDGIDIEVLPAIGSDDLVDGAGNSFADGTQLSMVLPKGTTLYHEGFHAFFEGEFLGGADELYSVSECIKSRQDFSMRNPENYVFFSVVMWYRNQGWDFGSGRAVKIED